MADSGNKFGSLGVLILGCDKQNSPMDGSSVKPLTQLNKLLLCLVANTYHTKSVEDNKTHK